MKNKKWYPFVFIVLSFLFLLASFFCPHPFFKQNSLSLIGTMGGFFAFLYTQNLQSARFFKELFTEFNARFSAINEDLSRIKALDEWSPHDEGILIDYFNLCAEEYFFFQAGYISPVVWNVWRLGMASYLENPKIKELWNLELKSGSYYGLNMQKITQKK